MGNFEKLTLASVGEAAGLLDCVIHYCWRIYLGIINMLKIIWLLKLTFAFT
jgi:hypothetical protein